MTIIIEPVYGTHVDVPEEEAQALLLSGQGYQLSSDVPVPVKDEFGEYYKVAPQDLGQAIGTGMNIASEEAYQDAVIEGRYGSVGNQMIAGAEGAARGLTFGLSDAIAAGADPELAKAMAHRKRINSGTALTGEIGAILLASILTGGVAGGAAGAAGAARTGGGILRAATAMPRLVAGAGRAAEGLATRALGGAAAPEIVGRIAARAIPMATGSAVEGAFYGAGHAISEASLGNTDLTADRLLTSVGHGAFIGGVAGAVLGSGAGALEARAAAKADGAKTLVDDASAAKTRVSDSAITKELASDSAKTGVYDKAKTAVYDEVKTGVYQAQKTGTKKGMWLRDEDLAAFRSEMQGKIRPPSATQEVDDVTPWLNGERGFFEYQPGEAYSLRALADEIDQLKMSVGVPVFPQDTLGKLSPAEEAVQNNLMNLKFSGSLGSTPANDIVPNASKLSEDRLMGWLKQEVLARKIKAGEVPAPIVSPNYAIKGTKVVPGGKGTQIIDDVAFSKTLPGSLPGKSGTQIIDDIGTAKTQLDVDDLVSTRLVGPEAARPIQYNQEAANTLVYSRTGIFGKPSEAPIKFDPDAAKTLIRDQSAVKTGIYDAESAVKTGIYDASKAEASSAAKTGIFDAAKTKPYVGSELPRFADSLPKFTITEGKIPPIPTSAAERLPDAIAAGAPVEQAINNAVVADVSNVVNQLKTAAADITDDAIKAAAKESGIADITVQDVIVAMMRGEKTAEQGLRDIADIYAFKAAGAEIPDIQMLAKFATDTQRHIPKVIREILPKLVGRDSVATMSHSEIVKAIEVFAPKAYKEIDDLFSALDKGSVLLRPDTDRVVRQIYKDIRELRGMPGSEREILALKRLAKDIVNKGEGAGFLRLHKMRSFLDKKIDWSPKGSDVVNEYMKRARGYLENEIERSADEAAKALGLANKYKQAKMDYQAATWIKGAAKKAVEKELKPGQLTLRDQLVGVSGAFLLANPILGMAMAVSSHVVGNVARARLNQVFAHAAQQIATGKMGHLIKLDRAAAKVEEATQSSVSSYFSRLLSGGKDNTRKAVLVAAQKREESPRALYKKRVKEINELASNPQQLIENMARSAPGMSEVAPKTYFTMVQRTQTSLAYLQSQIPQKAIGGGLQPWLDKYEPTDQEIDRFNRIYDAIDNPMTVLDAMAKGKLTPEVVEALQVGRPDIYDDMRLKTSEQLTSVREQLPYNARIQIGILMQIQEADPSLNPRFIQSVQSVYETQELPSPPPSGGVIELSQDRMASSDKLQVAQ